MKIVLASGGFDPLHSGHLSYLSAARQLGDKLIVGVNSDNWLARKKGRALMPIDERVAIIGALKYVDMAMPLVNLDDDDTAITFIKTVLNMNPNCEVIFANGGDRTKDNIPEMSIIDPRLSFAFGVGGTDKMNSSSTILEDWQQHTKRGWGFWRVLADYNPHVKVKELVVEPGAKLSMQFHHQRSELWFVAKGSGVLDRRDSPSVLLSQFQSVVIPVGEWHQLRNSSDSQLHIIEIQWGDKCDETDITRL